MNTAAKKHSLMISGVAVSLLLASCGGGGGGVSAESQPLIVTGVAATGAPMANGSLQIYDKTGAAVLSSPVTIDSNGSYTATIPATAIGPFVFEVDTGSDKVYSVLSDKSSSSVVNITPISHLIAAKLSTTGSPFNLATEIAAGSTKVKSSDVTSATTTVMTALQPLAIALNIDSSTNPISSTFTANGSGFDRMLDSLDVKIEPKGTASHIEVTLKQAVDESAELPKISFAHNATPTNLPTVDAAKLVDSGLTPKIQALLDTLTDCFKVPLATRISANGSQASHIQSQTCKNAFYGSDPTLYKSGGMVIHKLQHYGGIFTADTSAGVTFLDPKFFYKVGATVANGPTQGDIVFGYRWKDEFGNFQIEKNVARIDTDGKLKLVGNQYTYDIGVGPYSQKRNYLKQPDSTYLSTGYSFNLSCYHLNEKLAANEKIKKVKVTSPGNRVITLIPNLDGNGACNYSYFVVAFSNTTDAMGDPATKSGTGFVRLQSAYTSKATTSTNHPRKLDSQLWFFGGVNGTDLTDDEIKNIPQMGVWKFEYFKSTNAGTQPVATQYFKTTSRALTIDGFKNLVKLPELTTSLATKLVNDSTCSNSSPLYCFYSQASGPFAASWTKSTDPGLAPATYMARIYGLQDKTASPLAGYEDSLKFGSGRSSANIRCGEGSAALQGYCTGTASNPAFSANATIDALDLVSRASDGTDVSHFHTLRKLQ